jgi:uncharacterized protein YlxW (UPF0749 family)
VTDATARPAEPVDETRSDLTGEIKVVSAPAPNLTGQHQALAVPTVAGRSRPSKWSALLLVMAALLSFVVVSQVRQKANFRDQLNTESEGDLARILSSLSSESSSLQQELARLKVDLANLQNSTQTDGTATAEAEAKLNALQVLAGTVPVSGPGLEMRIDDSQHQLKFAHIVDAVQELRDAGAEALAINDRRIGVATAFGSADGQITMDNKSLGAPYVLKAIGPASTMEGGLKIPGGAIDTIDALDGATVQLTRSGSLTLAAVEEPLTFRAARPVGSQP